MSLRKRRSKKKSKNNGSTFKIDKISDDKNINNLNIVPNGWSVEQDWNIRYYPVCSNVVYVVINDFHSSYLLHQNFCYKIKMIYFNTKWILQMDGYSCKPDETVQASTFFDYKVMIQFVQPNKNFILFNNELSFVKSEFGENFKTFFDDNENNLINGDAVLLRIEVDSLAISKHRLVLEYLNKSHSNELCSNYVQLSLIESSVSRYPLCNIINKDFNDCFLLKEKMNEVFNTIQIGLSDIILVYGGANSGKTTLIHHLINRYISEDLNPKAIYYMECDPGQTEFTPCGILSLVKIDNIIPLTPGFKFLHSNSSITDKQNIFSTIFGAISPLEYSFQYKASINKIINYYKSLRTNLPLIINTMGWIEDIGLDLLAYIIKVVKPNHVLRISSSTDNINSNNTIEVLNVTANHKHQDLPIVSKLQKSHSYKLWSLNLNLFKHIRPSAKPSSFYRKINQLSYLISNYWPTICYKPFFSMSYTK